MDEPNCSLSFMCTLQNAIYSCGVTDLISELWCCADKNSHLCVDVCWLICNAEMCEVLHVLSCFASKLKPLISLVCHPKGKLGTYSEVKDLLLISQIYTLLNNIMENKKAGDFCPEILSNIDIGSINLYIKNLFLWNTRSRDCFTRMCDITRSSVWW